MTEYEIRLACVEIYAASLNVDAFYEAAAAEREIMIRNYKNGIKSRSFASVQSDFTVLKNSSSYREARLKTGYE